VGPCEHGNEPSVSVKCGKFLHSLGEEELLHGFSYSLYMVVKCDLIHGEEI
jgi:hypothetical protein